MREVTDKKRVENLHIPLTKEEKDAIKAAADECGMLMTTFARVALLKSARKED